MKKSLLLPVIFFTCISSTWAQPANKVLDFHTSENFQADFSENILLGKNGLYVNDNSRPGILLSKQIKVPLTGITPFLGFSMGAFTENRSEINLVIYLRTTADEIKWSEWQVIEVNHETGASKNVFTSELYFFDSATKAVQFKIELLDAQIIVRQISLNFINPDKSVDGVEKKEVVDANANNRVESCPCPQPSYTPRSSWGAPAGATCSPNPTTTVTHLIVHHQGQNGTISPPYSAVVFGIYTFHTTPAPSGNGWCDIGYNWLIDPNGQLYEGRGGGNNVIGAHFSCMNTGTMGVCLLGNFTNTTPTSSAITKLQEILAWKCCDVGISPTGTAFHPASGLTLNRISGHRDGNPSTMGCSSGTVCPGNNLYNQLPSIRTGVNTVISNCGVVTCPQPTNDGCSGSFSATQLTVGTSCNPVSSTSCGATSSGFSSCVGNMDDDVFFRFTAPSPSVTITVVGSSGYDAVIQPLTGPCGGSMSALGCVDNTANGGTETITLTGLTTGTQYFIRVWHYGAGSGTGTFTICVYNSCTSPGQPSSISGNSNPCIGQQNYSVTNVSGVTYAWSLSGGGTITGSGNTASVNWTTAGNWVITVTPSNSCGTGPSRTLSVTVTGSPNAGTISGTTPLCVNATANYTSNGTAGGTWSSSNPSVATVNSSTGLVTAMAAGTATITYSVTLCGNTVTANRTLTVNANVSAGTISGTSPLCVNATANYTSNGTAGGTWSSSNPAVATVNSSGLVTAIAPGTTNIIYTLSTGCGSPASSSRSLTVTAAANAGTVSGTSPLCVNATTNYTSNGTSGGTWSSSNTSVAAVNSNTGQVTAIGAGTTIITYTVTACGNTVSANQSLTVNANVSAGTVSGTSPLCVNATANYTSNGTTGGTWSSSNISVATVNSNTGQVTAVGQGTALISYTVNSGCGSPVSSSVTLTVTATANAGTISGTSPLCVNATTNYTTNGTSGGTWSSSNTSVAAVNSNTGQVTAIGAGTAIITYTVTACGNTVSTNQNLTVNANVSAGTISGNSPLCINATSNYTSNGTTGGIWSSSNPAVATVNSSGLVTAVGAGAATITYTINTGCGSPVFSSKTVTVASIVNAGAISGVSPMCPGEIQTYTTNGTSGGTWSSSNPAVATINSITGQVTAVSPGLTTIIYSVNPCTGGVASAVRALNVLSTGSAAVSIAQVACSGNAASNTVIFAASPTNGGTAPQFTWSLISGTGTPATGTGSTFVLTNTSDGSKVQCVLTSNASCITATTVSSNIYTINCLGANIPPPDILEYFSIFPNPTQGVFVINYKLINAGQVYFSIFDLTGRSVYESDEGLRNGPQTKLVDFSHLPAGIYFVRVTAGTSNFTKKLIIQRP